MSYNGSPVEHNKNGLPGISRLSDKTDGALLPVMKIDPLKTFTFKVKLMECPFTLIKPVEIPDPLPGSLMERILKNMPFEALLMSPLPALTKFTSHEQEFFPGMSIHVPQ